MIASMFRWMGRLWSWLCRLVRARDPEPSPAESDSLEPMVEASQHLRITEAVGPPIQILFQFSPSQTNIALDPTVWNGIFQGLPRQYRIPDPDFTRVMAVQTALRSLRWAIPMVDDRVSAITLFRNSWNPPYEHPVLDGADIGLIPK